MPNDSPSGSESVAPHHQAAANLSALIESTEDLIWSVDLNHGILTFNSALQRHVKRNFGTQIAVGKRPEDLLPPERAAIWPPLFERALTQGPFRAEIPFPVGRTLEMSFNPIIVDGMTTGLSMFGKDITEHKAGEESRRFLATLVESSEDGIIAYSPDGVILSWNHGAESLFGYPAGAIVGKNVAILAAPGRASAVPGLVGRVAQGGVIEPFDTRLCARSGDEIDVSLSISPIRNAEGQVVGASAIARDIRERKRIERELQQAEKKFREIFDGALEGMFQTTFAGQCLMANPAMARMLGYTSPEEVVAAVTNSGRDVWADPGDRLKFLRQLDENGVVLGYECQHKRKDGTRIWVSLNCRKALAADGRTLVNEGFIEDITERKQTEMALRESLDLLKEAQVIGALGSYVLDIATQAWTSSEIMDEIFGIGPDFERTLAGWTTLIHPDERASINSYFLEDVLGKKMPFDREYRIVRRRDQAQRWVHGLGRLEFNAQGQPVKMRGVIKDITGHKLAELKLRESEGRYRATFEQAAVGILHTSLDGHMLGSNARFAEIIGYPLDEVLGLTFQQITPPEDRDESLGMLQQMLNGAIDTASWEKRYLRKDGSLTWVRLTVAMRRDEHGRALNFITLVEDINARKAAEERLARVQEALRTSEAHYRTIFQTSVDGICISRLSDGRYIDANKAFLDLMGFQREEVIGRTSFDLNIWAEPGVRGEMLQALRRDSSFRDWETRYIKKNGELIWIQVSASLIGIAGVSCILSVVRDITEAKAGEERLAAAQEALRLSEERYRTAFQTSIDAVNINRLSDGIYIECNKAFLDITGFTRDDVIGRSSLDLGIWANPEDRRRMVHDVFAHSFCRDFEAQFRAKNGKVFWGLMSATLIEIEGVPCVLTITRDISEAKAAAQRLATAAEALRVSEERYRKVFQTNIDPILICRADNQQYIDVNQGFLDVMGFEREEVIGRTALELNLWVDLRDLENVRQILHNTSECRNLEIQFRKKNGEKVWTLMSASIIEIDGVRCVLAIARDISDAKAAEDEIRSLAFYDTLTGLPNRRLLLERLRQSLAAGSRTGRMRALFFVDLDNFKTLNDTLGHQTGDLLLQEAARRLAVCVRDVDTVSRLGGDEFVLMLDDLSELPEEAAAQAKLVGEKILATVAQPYLLDGRECRSSASIGISVFGDRRENTDEILQQADIAMYQAKAAGRNGMRFFAPALQAAVNARAALEEDLRQAIQTGQFVLYYQPQIDRNRLSGAEVLIRWKHPWRNILLPGEFIPLAEETGLILPLGKWVLEAACAQIAAWADRKPAARLAISVNISARQFHQPDFVEQVLSALQSTGANPGNLRLELTESMLVENIEEVIAKMSELKSHGLRFSLDDFGTGYSSLAYLKRLPLDQLKIDRSFIRDILTEESSAAIAQTIISLSRAMGLPVIAEGVETEEQREFLSRLGCHAFQGFLFSRPLPLDDFQRQWLPTAKDAITAAS